ncbi:MAG: hypothetical protein K2N60_01835 [Oscillospiraceae bacterium]|nr:hypothetical protein [Oscillospiraceae bacterium]
MNGKVIAIAAALAVCTALAGCAEEQCETVSKTGASVSAVTSSAASETESETTALTTSRTDTETEKTAVSETEETVQTEAVPKIEVSDLKAVYGEKLYSTPECRIVSDFSFENEADFPAPEHIALARKTAFADEKCIDEINFHNEDAANEKGFIPVETAEDIAFSEGACYDFDGDGELESVIVLDLAPTPSWAMGSSAVYYVDSENIINVGIGCIPTADVYSLDFGTEKFVQIDVYNSFTSMNSDIYRVGGDTLEPEIVLNATNWIKYRNGVFYCTIKYDFADYPIVFCEDGKFRQLGIKEITEEDFTSHIENGQEYLEILKAEDRTVTGIYTMGFYRYMIDMDRGFICFYIDENGNAVQNSKAYGFLDNAITEELDYDIDVSKLDIIPYSK